jgi:hypothetical protein
MPGLKQLTSWFETAALVRPSADTPNFTDLSRAIALLAGADGVETTQGVERLQALIGPADHYVLVLIDGLGMELLAKAPEGGFLRTHLAEELHAVFPSTTAVALSTLATTLWPAEHAVIGWWLYLVGRGLSITPLPFVDRFSKKPLVGFGVAVEEVFPERSVWSRMRHRPATIIGAQLADSVYTRYASGGTPRVGYEHTAQAFEATRRSVVEATGRTLTYLYLPHVDSLMHEKGTQDKGVRKLITEIDGYLKSLVTDLDGKARIIVTADHGQANIPKERVFIIKAGDPVAECLIAPPSGEPTVPVFHVKPGRKWEFKRLFAERLGEYFALLSPDDAERLELFGPRLLSTIARQRLGSYLAVASPPSALYYDAPGAPPVIHIGVHAGLSSAEMRIPLILA